MRMTCSALLWARITVMALFVMTGYIDVAKTIGVGELMARLFQPKILPSYTDTPQWHTGYAI